MEEGKKEVAVEVACMDFRDPTGEFKNAGASVEVIREQIIKKYSNPEEKVPLNINCHIDCGAVKAAAMVLDGADLGLSRESAEAFERTFVRYFRGEGFEGATNDHAKLQKMYEFNRQLQERLAKEILAGIGRSDVEVNARLIDVPMGLHADTVVVALGRSGKSNSDTLKAAGSVTGEAYLIRSATADEVAASLEIAKKVMGKTDIRVIALDAAGETEKEGLMKRSFMRAKNHT